MIFFLRLFLWSILAFLICGNCLLSLQNVLQQMGNRITILGSIKHPTPRIAKTYSCCILTPMPWARLHPTISVSLERKRICYSFILSKLVYHFTMVTLQKHYYTNNPIQLKIHSLLCMLQYLWHGRVYIMTPGFSRAAYTGCPKKNGTVDFQYLAF